VLVAAGSSSGGAYLTSAELYDPATGTWTATGALAKARYGPVSTLLPSGKVLLAGGFNGTDRELAETEIYDPVTGSWSLAAPMSVRRARHTATLLPNGDVLVVGGAQVGSLGSVTATAEIYHPATNSWRSVPSMSTARLGHTAALLPNGDVLVAGGHDGTSYVASSEIFHGSLSNPPTASAGPDQTVRQGSLVHLDGGASTDDVTPVQSLAFTWTLTSVPAGSTAALSGASTATPSFLADRPGVYTAELVVTDGDGQASQADQVQVISNAAPVAILEVPALSREGALLLAMLLVIAALSLLRRAG